jgi:hypothetical protein
MLIAISESRRPRRNSVRYPVNAGLNPINRLPDLFALELVPTGDAQRRRLSRPPLSGRSGSLRPSVTT